MRYDTVRAENKFGPFTAINPALPSSSNLFPFCSPHGFDRCRRSLSLWCVRGKIRTLAPPNAGKLEGRVVRRIPRRLNVLFAEIALECGGHDCVDEPGVLGLVEYPLEQSAELFLILRRNSD
jgi:hypothetical protein